MKIPNVPILSFNSGELSPQIDARSDVEKYASGCRILENMIPRIYGGAERRPGTQYIDGSIGLSTPLALLHTIAIANAAQLQLVGSTGGSGAYPLNGKYYLTADIDCTSISDFVPIGTTAAPFTGTFDGCGYIISNLTQTTNRDNLGLFGYCSGATLYNFTISNAVVNATAEYGAGILASYVTNTTVQQVRVSGTVTCPTGGSGGMIGRRGSDGSNNTFRACTVDGVTITDAGPGQNNGLFAGQIQGTFIDCFASGTIAASGTANSKNGGFIGTACATSTFTRCSCTGTIPTQQNVQATPSLYYNTNGGFAGTVANAAITFSNCYYLESMNARPYGGEDEEQRLEKVDVPTAGTWTLTFDGKTTGAIAYNANQAAIQAALNATFGVNVLEVLVASHTYFYFRNQYSRRNVDIISIDKTNLTFSAGDVWNITVTNEAAYPSNTTSPSYKTILGDPSNIVRMVPFIYSADIAYEIAFGTNYAAFYYDGEPLLDDSDNHVVITTPYLTDDIFQLQFKQIADVMWITHPSYNQRKLSRTTATSFALDVIPFVNGPFLTRNDIQNDDGVTLACSVTAANDTGTLTVVGADVFEEGHVNALFKLTHKNPTPTVTQSGAGTSSAIYIKGTFSFNTHGTWTGTVKIQRNETGESGDWEDYRTFVGEADRNISFAGTEQNDNVQYRILAVAGMSAAFGAEITTDESTWSGVVRIDTVVGPRSASVTVLSTLGATDATVRWAEGAWSEVQGYPASVTFFEERCCFAGNGYAWLSGTGDYEDFEEGVNDADSFTLRIPTTNEIRWIDAVESLLVGTSGDEWRIASSELGEPLTPTNFSVKRQSKYGSANIQSMVVNDTVLFVDFVGRKIRELVYNNTQQKYVAPDLTALAEHITESGIVCMAHQRNPDSIVWAVLGDGSLVSMTYERDQNVIAWAKHPTTGTVQSVSVIPGATEDEVWLSVTREINNVDVTFIERFAPRTFATKADAFFVDAGITYSGSPATSITGLDHLEGETVAILADGLVIAPQSVTSGAITLATAASKVHVGLPFTYKLQPMRLDITTQGGSRGMIKRIYEIVISFLNTLNAKYGDSASDLYDINWAQEQNTTEEPVLHTGDVTVNFAGGFSVDDPILISGSDPLPCCVRAIIPKVEVTE
jgi:hypothetical protein